MGKVWKKCDAEDGNISGMYKYHDALTHLPHADGIILQHIEWVRHLYTEITSGVRKKKNQ